MNNYINIFCFKQKELKRVVTVPIFFANMNYIPKGEIWVANNLVTRFDIWLLHRWINNGCTHLSYNDMVYVFVQGDICTYEGIHEAPPVTHIPYVPWEQLTELERTKLQPWIVSPVDQKYIRIVEETFDLPFGKVTTDSAVFVCDGFYISIYEARCNGLFVE